MIKKKKPKFLRIGYTQYSKLGLRRKNKQKYRKAKGGENKMRLKMKGHLRNVDIGFRSDNLSRYKVMGLTPVKIFNLKDLKKLKKEEIAIVGNIGDKNKMEICKYAIEKNIRLYNINPKKFILKLEESIKKRKEDKYKIKEKKSERDKKAKDAEKKKDASDKKKEDKKESIESKVEKKEEKTEQAHEHAHEHKHQENLVKSQNSQESPLKNSKSSEEKKQ